MKKILILIVSLMIILTGCGQSEPKTETTTSNIEQEQSKETVEIDKGLLSVEITLPVSMFEDQNIDEVITKAKEDGVDEVTKNEDGSLTYKMSKAKHKEMMEGMKDSIIQSVEEMKTSGDYASIQNIEYNSTFSEFIMTVDKSAYENGFDGFAALGLAMQGLYYQAFNGADSNKNKVKIDLKDASTNEVFSTIIYPDALNQ